jgi:hypothetical protein
MLTQQVYASDFAIAFSIPAYAEEKWNLAFQKIKCH